ncbi:alpha/beta hydrolase [Leucobacter tenebrionis]|uniref:alpha/beta hydrolase n=1 Tax=Leucobacter tenebrionis TaxID=2873270 RepID=UPI001CA6397B|nr:alpha/beta hydrolase [Leucobacter tenebrionis]QZY52993.1 alpha/beta hydrolase family protein [Leucobacter tenebrionis]
MSEPSPIIGDIAAAEQAVSFARSVAEGCMAYLVSIETASRILVGATGAAVRRMQAKLDTTLLTGAVKLKDSADAAQRGFALYVSSIEGIHMRARTVQQSVDGHLAVIRAETSVIEDIAERIRRSAPMSWESPPPPVLPGPALDPTRTAGMDELEEEAARRALVAAHETRWQHAVMSWTDALDGIRDERANWENLIAERRESERALVATLRDTTLGQLITVGSMPGGAGPKLAIGHGIAGELWGKSAAPVEVTKNHPALAGLFPGGDGSGAWDSPPDPGAVAGWWGGLDDATQERLIHEVPWVIGNLPGLPYVVRDLANREMLKLYANHPTLLTPEQLKVAAEVQEILAREAGERIPNPPIQVIALDLSHRVPKAALSYGDSDSATHTSWAVPGMESDAHLVLPDWDAASRSLYAAQNDIYGFTGRGSVISWLGYDTPDLVDSLNSDGVLWPHAAREGAPRLAAELDGVQAARAAGTHETPSVAVFAHSYGTTTAATALTLVRHPVDSLTLIASAGIDARTVPSYEELRVEEAWPGQAAIYTTHAAKDFLAPSGAGLSGRGQPNPEARGVFWLHALSPVYEGALSFSSDGDPELGLLRTDGHSIIGEREKRGFAGISSSIGHGYLDIDTQSLSSLAQITTGRISERLADSLVVTEKPPGEWYMRPHGTPALRRAA